MDIALAVEGKSQLSSLFTTKVEIENRPQDFFGKEFEESLAQEFLNQKKNVNGKALASKLFSQKREDPTSINMASILFACTKDYSCFHSAQNITEAIIKAIEL